MISKDTYPVHLLGVDKVGRAKRHKPDDKRGDGLRQPKRIRPQSRAHQLRRHRSRDNPRGKRIPYQKQAGKCDQQGLARLERRLGSGRDGQSKNEGTVASRSD